MKSIYFTFLFVFVCLSFSIAQVNISFNPPANASYQYITGMDQTMKQTFMGQDINVKNVMEITNDMDVLKSSKDEKTVRMTYKDVMFNMDAMGISIKYDSKSSSTGGEGPFDEVVSNIFKGLIGQQIEIVFLSDGSVKEISGIDALQTSMNQASGAGDNPFALTMVAQFNEENVRQMMEQSMKIYPEKSVSKGDTWKVSNKFSNANVTELNVESTYTLRETDKNTAKADISSVVSSSDGKISGTQSGTVTFDLKTGLVVLSELQQTLKGVVSANGIDVPMEVTSKITSRTVARQ